MPKKPSELRHIKLTEHDLGVLACSKTILHRYNNKLFQKLRLSIDAFNAKSFLGQMTEEQERMLTEGGALMYHLMTDKKFLNRCKNIYNQNK